MLIRMAADENPHRPHRPQLCTDETTFKPNAIGLTRFTGPFNENPHGQIGRGLNAPGI